MGKVGNRMKSGEGVAFCPPMGGGGELEGEDGE